MRNGLMVSVLALALAVSAWAQFTHPVTPLRAETMATLREIERTRMLLGAAMWLAHDLRNLSLGRGTSAHAEAFDRAHLKLYETLHPLDYAASSVLAALDAGDDRHAADDLALIRSELPAVAQAVVRDYAQVDAAVKAAKAAALANAKGLTVKTLPGMAWADPLREAQRQAGVQIGWRTNLEPPATFREAAWNATQALDIRYQLDKARTLGVTHIVIKDPVLRWDFIEPRKGQYDFRALDRMLALIAQYGLKTKLVLPTFGGRTPDWLAQERPESLIRNDKGVGEYALDGGTYAHDFMGPIKREGLWYQSRPANLADVETRARFAAYVQAIGDHLRKSGGLARVNGVMLDLFHAQRHWRVPPGADHHAFVLDYYRAVADAARKAFPGLPLDLEVTDGEAHGTSFDLTADEWRSVGLTAIVGVPGVDSETPFFENVMRAAARETASARAGHETDGPFFYQNCEYGFGTMLSVNYFTSLLRDGLSSDGWFGPEGPLRWGYFPQIFPYNDRQLQWSGITNAYLAHRQAHALSPVLANTRVTPGDALLVLPSSSLGVKGFNTHRELMGWGWALTALKVPYDVLPEAALARGVPAQAKLLILPQAVHLTDAQTAVIRGYVQGGGTLISSLLPGTDGGKPTPLAEVLGCDLLRKGDKPVLVTQTGVTGSFLQMTVPHGMHSGKYAPVPDPDTGYPRKFRSGVGDNGGRWQDQPYQALESAPDAQTLAYYGTGEAAIVRHAFGKGQALTLGYPYGHELVFADWTSIAFGKIYNGWARDAQMLGMLRWLRNTLTGLGYTPPATAPEAWRFRLQRFENAASSLSFPKGCPEVDKLPWADAYTYLDPRPEHAIGEDHDEMDVAAELTWRDRPGVATRFLAVGNRESAYAGERASVQFWIMPHTFRIRINDPAVKWVYDVAAGVPVALERDAAGVAFRTTVPPALGRVFAVSTSDTVETFGGAAYPGLDFAALQAEVAAVAARKATPFRGATVCHAADIHEWLRARTGAKLTIGCGDAVYAPAARRLAGWLKKHYGITAEVSTDDGHFKMVGNENFQVTYTPSQAQILLGSAWSNNTIAAIDAMWPYNNGDAAATIAGRFTAGYAWPGGDRGLVTLTRDVENRNGRDEPFGLGYGNTDGYAPRGVDLAKQPYLRRRLLLLASTPDGAMAAARALERTRGEAPVLQAYEKADAPLPEGVASLYATPWRAPQVAGVTHSALQLTDRIGLYYKHVPVDWTVEQHVAVMKQLAAAGVARLRIAPHHGIYITKDWTAPTEREARDLRHTLIAAKQTGLRPCITFVHVPPVGTPGTRELQEWWRQGELLPAGEVGSSAFAAYQETTYLALKFILDTARAAGFTGRDSYDLELGQGLWWGAPCVPKPFPHTGLEALKPGGRIYEFDRGLAQRLREENYSEPRLLWAQTYHYFDQCTDDEVPPESAGRAISFYSAWTGHTTTTWLTGNQYEKSPGPNDTWPERAPLTFREGTPPALTLARPEGYMADRTRHDNLIDLMARSATPVAVTSLGTVPSSIPDWQAGGMDGWTLKSRGLTRSLALWLHAGAPCVLLHSAMEPGSADGGEANHSLLPWPLEPRTFTWQQAPPLVTLRAFADGLAGAKAVTIPATLHFRYAVSPDPVLIPASTGGGLLKASDAVVLLPFQLDDKRFSVAVYVMTPNIAVRMTPLRMTLQIDKRVTPAGVAVSHPSTRMTGSAEVLARTEATTIAFDVTDDVTWLRFAID
jgi:hypothetical protein